MPWHKLTLILLTTLTLSSQTNAASSDIYDDAIDMGGGIKYTWQGFITDFAYPWIYHFEHGWLYSAGNSPGDVWFWEDGRDWSWTGKGIYPWLYHSTKGWLYYDEGSSQPRYFYRADTNTWENDGKGLPFDPMLPANNSQSATYVVNDSSPVPVNVDGGHLNMTFNNLLVANTPATAKRTTTFDCTFTGWIEGYSTSGSMQVSANESYQQQDNTILLVNERIDLTITFNISGTMVYGDSVLEASYQPGNEWVLSRSDLGNYEPGTTIHSSPVTMHAHGYIRLRSGSHSDIENISETQQITETWVIKAHHSTYQVRGRVFENVVAIQRNTRSIDLGTGELDDSSTTYWVAPGEGIIRAQDIYHLYGEPLRIEITNSTAW